MEAGPFVLAVGVVLGYVLRTVQDVV
jgi:hypothetical protein